MSLARAETKVCLQSRCPGGVVRLQPV